MKSDGTFSAKNMQTSEQMSEKLGELKINDAEKTKMELERMQLENVELRKQLNNLQVNVSLPHNLRFTSEEIHDFEEYKELLEYIQFVVDGHFDDLKDDFEWNTEDLQDQLDELHERFVERYGEAEFGVDSRGQILSDIRDGLHQFSSSYNDWRQNIMHEIDEMETRNENIRYELEGQLTDVITKIENLTECEDDEWKDDCTRIAANGVSIPPKAEKYVNGSNIAQPTTTSNILVNQAVNLAQVPSTQSYRTSFVGNYYNPQSATCSSNSYIQANRAYTLAQAQSMQSKGGVNVPDNLQPNSGLMSSYVPVNQVSASMQTQSNCTIPVNGSKHQYNQTSTSTQFPSALSIGTNTSNQFQPNLAVIPT